MVLFGSFALISVAGVLQVLCQEQRSVTLCAWKGTCEAQVQIYKGTIVSAHCGELHGANAIYKLLNWEEGSFRVEQNEKLPAVRDLLPGWEELLLEGARLRDENNVAESPHTYVPSQAQLAAFLEVCPALAGMAAVGYDGQLLAEAYAQNYTRSNLPFLAISLTAIHLTIGASKSTVSVYISGLQKWLLADWGNQMLVLAAPDPTAKLQDAITQLVSCTKHFPHKVPTPQHLSSLP